MRIDFATLQGALQERSVGAGELIGRIQDSLRTGERVIVFHDDGQEELLEDDGKGDFKMTPIDKRK